MAQLTDRDDDLLITLTTRVHLLSIEQVAGGWWPESSNPIKNARRRLATLESADLVKRYRVNVHPLLPLSGPVATWSPAEAAPAFGPVAYQLQKRWDKPQQLTTVYIASRQAAQQFGGFGGKFKHRTQLTHDLHVSEIYIRRVAKDESIRARWCGEEMLARTGEKLPDAVLVNQRGVPERVIEFGGRYDARRIKHFHSYCLERSLPYELW